MHAARTHCRWLVDSTWQKYELNQQDTQTAAVVIDRYDVETVESQSRQDVDLFSETNNVTVKNKPAQIVYTHTMDTGYKNLSIPVTGEASISIQDADNELEKLVGKHIVANVSMFIDSSTVIDDTKATKMEFDLGAMLIGASWLSAPAIQNGRYYRRLSAVASGILASAIKGLWTVRVTWQVNHANNINDAFDNFIVHVDTQFFGYDGYRALLVVDR